MANIKQHHASKARLPWLPSLFIRVCSQREESLLILGDFAEEFTEIAVSKGIARARRWYWKQALKSFPVLLKTKTLGGVDMILHYCKIACRNMAKQKGYSFINLAGLTLGLACFIFIMIWVHNELSYDQFHEKKDRLFRILYKLPEGNYARSISYALPPAVKDKYPEVEEMARVWPWHRSLVKYEDKRFEEDRFYLTDPGFFQMFSFQFIHGSPETALPDKYSLVLTHDAARRYFGNQDPLGKTLRLDTPEADFVVTGVIAKVPSNSHLQFDMVGRVEWLGEKRLSRWDEWVAPAYVLLRKEAARQPDTFNSKLADIYRQHVKPDGEVEGVRPILQPLTKVHLYEYGRPGRVIKVYIFSIIALFILVMACINFMNLSTARSVQRAREVCMHKVLGASRSQLTRQFLGEAILFSFLAMVFAVLVVLGLFPAFKTFTGQKLSLSLLTGNYSILILLLVPLVTGLISGSYPALFLSSYKPVHTLKNLSSKNRGGSIFRRILIVFQFTISGGLILCTLIISKQMGYIQNKDLGLDRKHVVTLMNNPTLNKRFDTFKNELAKMPGILNITSSAQRPMQVSQSISINWKGNPGQDLFFLGYTMVDYDYFKTFNIPITQGRSFSQEFATDTINACILNETAVKRLKLENPIGASIYFNHKGIDPSLRNLQVVGVAKDVHFRSLHSGIGPFLFRIYRPWHIYVFIKIDASRIAEALQNIKKVFTKHAPDYPFWYEFLDAAFYKQYASEMHLRRLFNLFSMLSIIVACLGLFGLASFTAEQKTKEIGIRKVLGASVSSIVALTGKEFFKLIALANLIALPIGFYLMTKWLNNFTYKTGIGLWVFLFSTGLILIITFISICYQTLKAALANPVDSLRSE